MMASVVGSSEAWIDIVLTASDARRADADWLEWLHQVFREQGALDLAKLARVARADQIDRATKACTLAVADVSATTSRIIRAETFVDEWEVGQFVVRLRLDDDVVNGSGLHSIGIEELIVEVADAVQEEVMGQCNIWPECPHHDVGLHPQLDDSEAAWVCRVGNHRVALIGQLADVASLSKKAAKRRERRMKRR